MVCHRVALLLFASLVASRAPSAEPGLEVEFAESPTFDFAGSAPPDLAATPFTVDEKARIAEVVVDVEARSRALLADLPRRIRVVVARVDRDLSGVGGVSGRADAPGEVLIEISRRLEGGPAAAAGLRNALFHELHHQARGWTIRENRFGPGIAVAAVNEGLAEVFAEEQTGRVLAANEYPDDVDEWAREILALPNDADYVEWMFAHPDGREAIGYRTGRYLVHRAMANSGKTVLELSELSPQEIIGLAQLNP
ncbi:DUF2268 domain-containing putative Zn-dependent protease [Rubrivirga marina]|uniref:DUF2268 domain-containing protein n=1 Tax=Rubrivirga marina TaxID=1196024 RepID=A0A271IVC1_9BACT|nr:DUF2268 domain-containing putative Zn-dependent protease [Rubrivirga marina]PAP75060.1 hypothetical protein BSZ37_00645 [Rubrivirga marina]